MSCTAKFLVMTVLASAVFLASCAKGQKPSEKVTAEQSTTLRTFNSPTDAGSALFNAAKAADKPALLAIFGAGSEEVLFSGDAVQDKNNRERFIAAYTQMNRWSTRKDGSEILILGADNFPFPIPLKKNDDGRWSFDTAAGKQEVLARRIGHDELVAINVLQDIAGAQLVYFAQAHGGTKQFAQKFVSDTGQQNGLYWEAVQGRPKSPLAPLAEAAKELGYSHSDKPQPFDGYFYRILTKQGASAKGGARDYMVDGKLTRGFGVVAYPAKYRDSGIMTFLVGPDGVVYQKDLGEKTTDIASALQDYSPDETWASLSVDPIAAPAEPAHGPKRVQRESTYAGKSP